MAGKEVAPSLAEAIDRHTKKVKIRDQVFDVYDGVNKVLVGENGDVHMGGVESGNEFEVGISFKDKLLGSKGNSKSRLSSIDLDLQEQDVKMGVEDDMPTINFSNREKGILARSMNQSVVVKLLGKYIGYKALYSRISALCKL